MQDKHKAIVNLQFIILSIVLGTLLLGLMIFLILITNKRDFWFWAIIIVCLIGIIFLISLSVFTFSCVIIDCENLHIKTYNGMYDCLISNLECIEWRKTAIGKEAIFIHMKEPMRFYRRGRHISKKDRKEYVCENNKKIITLLKHNLLEEIPWVYNDYYKNPNLEPKKPKKK